MKRVKLIGKVEEEGTSVLVAQSASMMQRTSRKHNVQVCPSLETSNRANRRVPNCKLQMAGVVNFKFFKNDWHLKKANLLQVISK